MEATGDTTNWTQMENDMAVVSSQIEAVRQRLSGALGTDEMRSKLDELSALVAKTRSGYRQRLAEQQSTTATEDEAPPKGGVTSTVTGGTR